MDTKEQGGSHTGRGSAFDTNLLFPEADTSRSPLCIHGRALERTASIFFRGFDVEKTPLSASIPTKAVNSFPSPEPPSTHEFSVRPDLNRSEKRFPPVCLNKLQSPHLSETAFHKGSFPRWWPTKNRPPFFSKDSRFGFLGSLLPARAGRRDR